MPRPPESPSSHPAKLFDDLWQTSMEKDWCGTAESRSPFLSTFDDFGVMRFPTIVEAMVQR